MIYILGYIFPVVEHTSCSCKCGNSENVFMIDSSHFCRATGASWAEFLPYSACSRWCLSISFLNLPLGSYLAAAPMMPVKRSLILELSSRMVRWRIAFHIFPINFHLNAFYRIILKCLIKRGNGADARSNHIAQHQLRGRWIVDHFKAAGNLQATGNNKRVFCFPAVLGYVRDSCIRHAVRRGGWRWNWQVSVYGANWIIESYCDYCVGVFHPRQIRA